MKIINITQEAVAQIYTKDAEGKDVYVYIKPGEFVFCPTKEKTKSINLLLLKKSIDVISDIEKPIYLEYLTPYNENSPIVTTEDKVENIQEIVYPQFEDIEIAVDSYMNVDIVQENNIVTEESKDDIVDSYINEEAIVVIEPEKKEKKRYRYKRKKKMGRKKKRGPKKKKKPIGRPKGSVPKVGRPKKKRSVGRPKNSKKKNPVGRPKGKKNKRKK